MREILIQIIQGGFDKTEALRLLESARCSNCEHWCAGDGISGTWCHLLSSTEASCNSFGAYAGGGFLDCSGDFYCGCFHEKGR